MGDNMKENKFVRKLNKSGTGLDSNGKVFNGRLLIIPNEIKKELPSLCTKKNGKK
jgi:hypothetical protein